LILSQDQTRHQWWTSHRCVVLHPQQDTHHTSVGQVRPTRR
jgi:hypothetical protein